MKDETKCLNEVAEVFDTRRLKNVYKFYSKKR